MVEPQQAAGGRLSTRSRPPLPKPSTAQRKLSKAWTPPCLQRKRMLSLNRSGNNNSKVVVDDATTSPLSITSRVVRVLADGSISMDASSSTIATTASTISNSSTRESFSCRSSSIDDNDCSNCNGGSKLQCEEDDTRSKMMNQHKNHNCTSERSLQLVGGFCKKSLLLPIKRPNRTKSLTVFEQCKSSMRKSVNLEDEDVSARAWGFDASKEMVVELKKFDTDHAMRVFIREHRNQLRRGGDHKSPTSFAKSNFDEDVRALRVDDDGGDVVKQDCCNHHEDEMKVNDKDEQDDDPRAVLRFGVVTIREYPIIVGDNPSVSKGVPVSIAWDYISEVSFDCITYETARVKDSTGGRKRNQQEMFMTSTYRFDLLRNLGFSLKDRQKAIKSCNIIRKQRMTTYNNIHNMKRHEKIENVTNKMKNLFSKLGMKKKKQKKVILG